MDIENAILLVTTTLNLCLAVFVYLKDRKDEVNVAFASFAFFIALWSLVLSIFRLESDLGRAIWWMKLTYVSATLIGCSFWYFASKFPKKEELNLKYKLGVFIPTIIIVILLLAPGFLVKDVFLTPWGKEVILSKSHLALFTIYFVFFFFGGLYIIWKKCRIASGVLRRQLLYILFSVLIAGSLGVLFNLIFPWMQNHRFIWIGPIFTAAIVVCVVYAILKYRLMDIRLIIKRSILYIVLIGIITILFTSLMYIVISYFDTEFSGSALILIIITSLAFIFGLDPLKKSIQRFLDRTFPKGIIDFSAHLDHFRERTIGVVEIEALTERVLQEVKNIVPVQDVALLVKDKKENIFHEFGSSSKRRLSFKNELVDLLERESEILIREEIKHAPHPSWIKELSLNRREIIRLLKNIDAFLCVPLLEAEELIGIVILGEKENKDAYTSEEIKFLKELAPQISFALANVLAYHYALVSAMRMAKEGEV